MVERVADALAASQVGRVYAVTAPHAPRTQAILDRRGLATIETAGDGYVADLQAALADDRVEQPVLTVAADLPLLHGPVVDSVLTDYDGGSLTVGVPAARVRALGYSVDTTMPSRGQSVRPAGLNVVAPGEDRTIIRRDRALAANVNRPRDLQTAAWHLAGDRSSP